MGQYDNANNPGYQEHIKTTVAAITEQLKAFGEKYKLRGLEGRVQRGLDPAGMLAVEETRKKLETIAQSLGAKPEVVVNLTNELHVGAIWKNADALANGGDPNMQAWMVAGEVTVRGKEKEGDLSDEEFVLDLERVNRLLDEAVADPKGFAEKARTNLITHSKEQFKVEDGVPISELDEGFLAMAVNGYHSGIVKDKDGLLFVGANDLDYGSLEQMGLKMTQREDRGRQATFYTDSSGKDVVKKLYPGFAIVLTGDMETAKQLARTGEEKTASQKQ
jgi:hypothetical protein